MRVIGYGIAALVIAGGLSYVKRVEIAEWAADRQLQANRRDVAFVASLAPTLCVYDKVNGLDFDSIPGFMKGIRYLSDELVPELERATAGAAPFDGPSRRLQSAILEQVRVVKDSVGTAKQTIARMGEDPNFFTIAIGGLSLLPYIEQVSAQIDQGDDRIHGRWDEYVEALGQRLESDMDPLTAAAAWTVAEWFPEADAVRIVNQVVDRIVSMASSDPRFRQAFRSGCLNGHILSLNRTLASALTESEDSYKFQVVCLVNSTTNELTYQYRWGGVDWQDAVLDPGASRWHSNVGDDSLSVQFDGSLRDGYQPTNYWLRTRTAGDESCEVARRYSFMATAAALDLKEVVDVR